MTVEEELAIADRHQKAKYEKDQAVQDAKGGQVEYRVEKAGLIHVGVGKASFDEQALAENVRAFIGAISKAKPSGVKGTYIMKASISSTMGPGIKLDMPNALGND